MSHIDLDEEILDENGVMDDEEEVGGTPYAPGGPIVPGDTTFGKWLVLEAPYKKDGTNDKVCKCRCRGCGMVEVRYLSHLKRDRSSSCGQCKTFKRVIPLLRDSLSDQTTMLRTEIEREMQGLRDSLPALIRTNQPIVKLPPAPAPTAATSPATLPMKSPVIVPTGHTDIGALKARVEQLLDPLQDINPRSAVALRMMRPPNGYNPNPSLDDLRRSFEANKYFITSEELFSVHQAISQGKPILADGPPGTGKTSLAIQITLAMGLNPENPNHFHSLFCTPDIAKAEALYDWNDSKRLLDIQLVREIASKFPIDAVIDIFQQVQNSAYSERYLDVQSLLRPCIIPFRTVVLADEIDKTYPEFDSYLLEIVVNNRFEVPGYGTLGREFFDPKTSPIFVFTTNRERELNRALARRMKPVWYDYLPEKLETRVVAAKCGLDELKAGRAAQFFYKIRSSSDLHLHQPPSTAEVIETCKALVDDRQEINPGNIFRYHMHWIKFRRDYDTLREKYYNKSTNKWADTI